jgi:hypothetical protein
MSEEKSEYPKVYTGDDLSTVQVLMSHELFVAFEAWIIRYGLEVSPPMLFSADDLPTYTILPPINRDPAR